MDGSVAENASSEDKVQSCAERKHLQAAWVGTTGGPPRPLPRPRPRNWPRPRPRPRKLGDGGAASYCRGLLGLGTWSAPGDEGGPSCCGKGRNEPRRNCLPPRARLLKDGEGDDGVGMLSDAAETGEAVCERTSSTVIVGRGRREFPFACRGEAGDAGGELAKSLTAGLFKVNPPKEEKRLMNSSYLSWEAMLDWNFLAMTNSQAWSISSLLYKCLSRTVQTASGSLVPRAKRRLDVC